MKAVTFGKFNNNYNISTEEEKWISNNTNDLLIKAIETLESRDINVIHDFILDSILKATKSQGGWTAIPEFTKNKGTRKIKGLKVTAIKIRDEFGDKSNVLHESYQECNGVFFHYKSEALYFQSIDKRKIIYSNDSDFLKKHQCIGFKIKSLMLIPLYKSNQKKKLVSFICLSNTCLGGYDLKIAELLHPLLLLLKNSSVILYKNSLSKKRRISISNENKSIINDIDINNFIAENSKEIVLIIDNDGNFINYSKTFIIKISKLLEISISSFNLSNIENFINNENTRIIYSSFLNILENKEIKEINTINIFEFDNEEKIYWDSVYGILFDNNGEKKGAYLLAKDISKYRILNDQLENSLEKTKEISIQKDIYISRISHELRTPLNAIYGFSQLVKIDIEQGNIPDIDNLNIILKSTKGLLHLVEDVLDLSSVRTGQIKLSIEKIDVKEILIDTLNMMQFDIKNRKIKLKIEDDNIKYFISGDCHRITQVFRNILSNAIKYNKEKGQIEIKFHATNNNSNLKIIIEDSGIGISKDKLKYIGQPFNRAGQENSKIQGTGIGLALTIALLDQMNSSFSISSIKDVGTTIELEFPLISQTVLEDESDNSNNFKVLGKKHILYIEDNLNNYKFMEKVVKGILQYELTGVTQGSQGIDIAKSQTPDLIILDFGLPDMPGDEVLLILKTNEITKNIPVIGFSADVNPSTIKRAKEIGVDDYLKKPCDIEIIIQTIKKYLK